jgi:hypothetical protein
VKILRDGGSNAYRVSDSAPAEFIKRIQQARGVQLDHHVLPWPHLYCTAPLAMHMGATGHGTIRIVYGVLSIRQPTYKGAYKRRADKFSYSVKRGMCYHVIVEYI